MTSLGSASALAEVAKWKNTVFALCSLFPRGCPVEKCTANRRGLHTLSYSSSRFPDGMVNTTSRNGRCIYSSTTVRKYELNPPQTHRAFRFGHCLRPFPEMVAELPTKLSQGASLSRKFQSIGGTLQLLALKLTREKSDDWSSSFNLSKIVTLYPHITEFS